MFSINKKGCVWGLVAIMACAPLSMRAGDEAGKEKRGTPGSRLARRTAYVIGGFVAGAAAFYAVKSAWPSIVGSFRQDQPQKSDQPASSSTGYASSHEVLTQLSKVDPTLLIIVSVGSAVGEFSKEVGKALFKATGEIMDDVLELISLSNTKYKNQKKEEVKRT